MYHDMLGYTKMYEDVLGYTRICQDVLGCKLGYSMICLKMVSHNPGLGSHQDIYDIGG